MLFDYFKLLKELVIQVSGKNTEVLVDILKSEKPVNEFKIADKLKLTINQARNILYKLYNQGIVAFVRKKDEKKGWYIYSWSLNAPKALERLKLMKEKEMNTFQHLLANRENKRMYKCPNDCMEVNEESAMLHQFTCPECGSVLNLESTEGLAKELKGKIEKAKREIIELDVELKKIDDVRLVQVEKKRLLKRRQNKAKRKRERNKLAKENKKLERKAVRELNKKAKNRAKKKVKVKKKTKKKSRK